MGLAKRVLTVESLSCPIERDPTELYATDDDEIGCNASAARRTMQGYSVAKMPVPREQAKNIAITTAQTDCQHLCVHTQRWWVADRGQLTPCWVCPWTTAARRWRYPCWFSVYFLSHISLQTADFTQQFAVLYKCAV